MSADKRVGKRAPSVSGMQLGMGVGKKESKFLEDLVDEGDIGQDEYQVIILKKN